jgi:hypothetical protein
MQPFQGCECVAAVTQGSFADETTRGLNEAIPSGLNSGRRGCAERNRWERRESRELARKKSGLPAFAIIREIRVLAGGIPKGLHHSARGCDSSPGNNRPAHNLERVASINPQS